MEFHVIKIFLSINIRSLGLVVAPRIRFLQSQVNRAKQKDEQEEEDEIAAKVDKKMKKKLKLKNKMKEAAEKKDETLNFSEITRPDDDDDDEENDNTLFTVKRVYNAEQNSQPLPEEVCNNFTKFFNFFQIK